MASCFPNLPGYVPTQDISKDLFKRVSANQQEKNKEIKNDPPPSYPLPRAKPIATPDQSTMLHKDYMSTTHDTYKPPAFEQTDQFQPNWVRLDRHVLRFYGFFKESVTESNLENYRLRKITLIYYLEDNSISVTETKQANSGIIQGAFVKRQKILNNNGSGKFLSAYDIKIGEDLIVFGKSIRICDCDAYTREFYENVGQPQGPSHPVPNDSFESSVLPQFKPKDWNGLNSSTLNGKVPSQKQFLENDRKVLRFYVFSDGPYIMHYYLADDTLEIREINYQNSGKEKVPLLLKRQKLPRKFALNQPGHTVAEDFIKDYEIQYGSSIEIFGRVFKINCCDQFTRDYYKEKYNIDFPLGGVEQTTQTIKVKQIIPPYNGFGDEEDSLGNVGRIILKPIKKDYFKWVDNQKYLRFTARFNTTKPEDTIRRFIITLYLNDDTILIYEPQQRNSGINGGKFLEKMKYKNAARNNEYFQPADFLIGKDVRINGYSFHILGCDEFTRKWYVENFNMRLEPNTEE